MNQLSLWFRHLDLDTVRETLLSKLRSQHFTVYDHEIVVYHIKNVKFVQELTSGICVRLCRRGDESLGRV